MYLINNLLRLVNIPRINGKDKVVIVVTDGDKKAELTIKKAAEKLHAEVIEESAGNPTPAQPDTILREVLKSTSDTVIVMADDACKAKPGAGSKIIEKLQEAGILDAAIAVASNTPNCQGVEVDLSVTSNKRVKEKGVNKYGQPRSDNVVIGDTVNALVNIDIPIVGIGDVGKAPGGPQGVQVMIKAIEEAKQLVEQYSKD